MVDLADRMHCSGCGACAIICSHGAISMSAEREGFLYPKIDSLKCMSCGRCRNVCSALKAGRSRKPLAVYAAKAIDDKLRRRSSSGGIFTLLARHILLKGGVVYGAMIRDGDLKIIHVAVETEDELCRLQGSKYVQSEVHRIYPAVLSALRQGRLVLFSGTPCQVAALRRLAPEENEHLICVEVICHGVPSALAWRAYLKDRMRKRHLNEKIITGVSFRDKLYGWRNYSMAIFTGDRGYVQDIQHDSFLRGFNKELFNRSSCYQCSWRELKSGSDVTIGDYWNVQRLHPDINDDIGVSLVLINSARGSALFNEVKRNCRYIDSSYVKACAANPSLIVSGKKNPQRERFFEQINQGRSFDSVVKRLTAQSTFRRIARGMRGFAGKMIRLMGGCL